MSQRTCTACGAVSDSELARIDAAAARRGLSRSEFVRSASLFAAGHEEAWFHDLRRTAVRNLERAGVSRSVAMKLTGHKTEAVFTRYAIADETALQEGVEKLARLHGDGDDDGRTAIPLQEARGG